MPQADQPCPQPGRRGQPCTSDVGGASRAAEPPQPFSVEAHATQKNVTVVLMGELDVIVMPALAKHLTQILAGQPEHLIFDMATVTFIDCATARLIVQAGQALPSDGRVLIRYPSAVVRQVLDVTRLASCCDIEESAGEV